MHTQSTTSTPVARWAQVLCTWHGYQTRHLGPTLIPDQIVDSCRDCATRARAVLTDDTVVRAYPHLPDAIRARITAVHEAGHAIVGLAAGGVLESITLTMGSKDDGRCTWAPTSRTVPAAAYAGMIVAGHHAAASWARRHGHDDDAMAIDLAMCASGDYAELRKLGLGQAAGHDYAAHIIATHWATIEAVADALLRRGQLTGAEVDALT